LAKSRSHIISELLSRMPLDLFKLGNYSLLRLLTIINAAGPDGITTRKLLDTIGSHDTHTQIVLDRAQKQGLIERVKGERPAPGQFPPIYNIISDRGKQLLQTIINCFIRHPVAKFVSNCLKKALIVRKLNRRIFLPF
jgi:DNA-binding MarR family transcriptional regulator